MTHFRNNSTLCLSRVEKELGGVETSRIVDDWAEGETEDIEPGCVTERGKRKGGKENRATRNKGKVREKKARGEPRKKIRNQKREKKRRDSEKEITSDRRKTKRVIRVTELR